MAVQLCSATADLDGLKPGGENGGIQLLQLVDEILCFSTPQVLWGGFIVSAK